MHTSDLFSSRPDLAAQLAHHERTSVPDEPLPDAASLAIIASLEAKLKESNIQLSHTRLALNAERTTAANLRSQLASSQRSFSAAVASERRAHAQLDHDKLVASCTPFLIGGRDGYPPTTLDIKLQECDTTHGGPLVGHARYIAWIPVPIYPFMTKGQYGPVIGVTKIRESLAFPTIYIPNLTSDTPTDPSHYRSLRVAITGYASINVNLKTNPDELFDRIEARDRREQYDLHTDPSEHPSDMDSPPFIPSLAAEQQAKAEQEARANEEI